MIRDINPSQVVSGFGSDVHLHRSWATCSECGNVADAMLPKSFEPLCRRHARIAFRAELERIARKAKAADAEILRLVAEVIK